MSRLFARARAAPSPQVTLVQLNDTRDILERRIAMLERQSKKAGVDALAYNRAKNKRAALMEVKRKKMFDLQIEQLSARQLSLVQVIGTIEAGVLQAETIGAMRQASATIGAIVQQCGDVDDVVDDMKEQVSDTELIAEKLSEPLGDEIDVDAELDELERELAPTPTPTAADTIEPDYTLLIAAAARAPEPIPTRRAVAEYAQ